MATVTGYTAERMQEIEDAAIVDGEVVAGDLILSRHDSSTINAGSVIGPTGPAGPSIEAVTSVTRPGSPTDGQTIYETDTKRYFVWDGAAWKWFSGNPMRCKVNRVTDQSIVTATVTAVIWTAQEYDTDAIWTPGGAADSLIIPTDGDGLWRFIASFNWSSNATGYRHIAITKNAVGLNTWNGVGSATWLVGGSLVVEDEVEAGDVIKLSSYHTAGINLDINATYPVSFSAIKLT